MTRALPLLLHGFVSRVRPLLDSGIGLRLHVAADCPEPTDVDAEQLEAALAEMLRRMIAVMPGAGWLDLQARASSQPPEQALIGTAATAGTWLALSVGSPQAGTPDQEWEVRPPRQNLAQFACRFRASLSVLSLEPQGTQLVLHLPGTRYAGPPAGIHVDRTTAVPSTSGG